MSAFSQITTRRLSGVSLATSSASVSIPHAVAAADTVSFIAQGSPISVKQFAFGSATLSPKKAGGIRALTRELSEHSDAGKIIRGLLLIENVGVSVDKLMLEATDTDGIRAGWSQVRHGCADERRAATKMIEDLTTLASAVAPKAAG